MPLIDGTYEILRQRALSGVETLVLATDPDGRPVRVVLYEVAPEHEAAFERHRRRLRKLGRGDDVLLRDVVSRPGAHFAVWDDPGDAPPTEPDGGWARRLSELGIDPGDAELRRDGRTPVLAGLRWDPAATTGDGDAAGHVAAPGSADGGRAGTAAPAPHPVPARRIPWRRLRPPSTPRARTALVALLFAAGATALALIGWERGDNDAVVVVPDLTGAPAQRAADDLARLGLSVVPQAQADGDAAGTVLATEPGAGTALRPGREIQLIYALPADGMATQPVPDLVGRALGPEVQARLREAELTLGRVARVPAALPADTVLAQRPSAGVRAGRGEGVTLVVSDGPRPATTFLPDLVGLPLEDARSLARVAGLPPERVLVDEVQTADAQPGTVVGMTPAAWHRVRADDVTLRMLVASGSSGSAREGTSAGGAPDLVGLDQATALQEARERGLATSVQRTTDLRLPSGVVLQDPPPGAATDGTVRLLVNARPVTLPTPDPSVAVLAPRLRAVPYRFLIEPGIPEQQVEVRATDAEGNVVVVHRGRATGGATVEGRWLTETPGPVRFAVYLNDVFYADTRVNP